MIRFKSSEYKNLINNKLIVLHVRTSKCVSATVIFFRRLDVIILHTRMIFRKRYFRYRTVFMGSTSTHRFISVGAIVINVSSV